MSFKPEQLFVNLGTKDGEWIGNEDGLGEWKDKVSVVSVLKMADAPSTIEVGCLPCNVNIQSFIATIGRSYR